MNFWNNVIRYARFFVSSFLGLILVLLSPFFQFSKEFKNKNFIVFGIFACFFLVLWILNLMLYSGN